MPGDGVLSGKLRRSLFLSSADSFLRVDGSTEKPGADFADVGGEDIDGKEDVLGGAPAYAAPVG